MELYRLFEETLDYSLFNGKEFSVIKYSFSLFIKMDKKSANSKIIDELSQNYIFLDWDSLLVYSDNKYHYELISIHTPSKDEIDHFIEFYMRLIKVTLSETSLVLDKNEMEKIIELSEKNHFHQGLSIIKDSELFGGIKAFRESCNLKIDREDFVNPKMIDYFDVIHFDNKGRWLVQYSDGNAGMMFSSFDMYWFYPEILEYVDKERYGLNFGDDDISISRFKTLLSESELEYAVHQREIEVQSVINRFNERKLRLLLNAERLYYIYSINRIELIVDLSY